MKRKLISWLVGIVIVIVITLTAVIILKRDDIQRSVEVASLPEPIAYSQATSPSPVATVTVTPIVSATKTAAATTKPSSPAEVNLAVPFTAQAPFANWDEPHEEFCEEASVLMAMAYVQDFDLPTPEFADQKLFEIKAFEDKRFGYYKDTTAAETAIIIRELYKYSKVELKNDPTIADIKAAVAAGRLVIVPAAGRLLGNPYFQTPGPLYHMIVVKGYTNDGRFIVNDPGTRRGANFLYSEATIMNAIHDWRTDQNIELGKKVVIIVG